MNMNAKARATIATIMMYVMVLSSEDIILPPPVETDIAFETVSVALLSSVTVRFTMYAPLVEYVWVGFWDVEAVPSPKSHD